MKFSDSMSQARIRYLNAARQSAKYEQMPNGQWVATIPKFEGLRAIGATRDEAWWNLRDAFDHWLDEQIKMGREVPHIHGLRAFEEGVNKLIATHRAATDDPRLKEK